MVSDGISNPNLSSISNTDPNSDIDQKPRRKRNLPGNPGKILVYLSRSFRRSKSYLFVCGGIRPDPKAQVIAPSPETLLAASSFVCEVCGKDFRRDQNLQIHRRGHNLPSNFPAKKAPPDSPARTRRRVFVCPEASCVHHHPSRALGDLTGIKKHYSRKHGEKRWECERCSKKYAVRTDWKAHTKICGSREYECHCGTLFSRKDSFLAHRAACEKIGTAEEREESPAIVIAVNRELSFPSLWGQSAE